MLKYIYPRVLQTLTTALNSTVGNVYVAEANATTLRRLQEAKKEEVK